MSKAFEAMVEIDEAYIGGKPRKKNNQIHGTAKRGKGTKKTPVIGVKERSTNRVIITSRFSSKIEFLMV